MKRVIRFFLNHVFILNKYLLHQFPAHCKSRDLKGTLFDKFVAGNILVWFGFIRLSKNSLNPLYFWVSLIVVVICVCMNDLWSIYMTMGWCFLESKREIWDWLSEFSALSLSGFTKQWQSFYIFDQSAMDSQFWWCQLVSGYRIKTSYNYKHSK